MEWIFDLWHYQGNSPTQQLPSGVKVEIIFLPLLNSRFSSIVIVSCFLPLAYFSQGLLSIPAHNAFMVKPTSGKAIRGTLWSCRENRQEPKITWRSNASLIYVGQYYQVGHSLLYQAPMLMCFTLVLLLCYLFIWFIRLPNYKLSHFIILILYFTVFFIIDFYHYWRTFFLKKKYEVLNQYCK